MYQDDSTNRVYVILQMICWLLFIITLLTSCDQSHEDPPELGIQVNDELPILGIGHSIQLQMISNDNNILVDPEQVVWESSDTDVMIVSKSGVVTSTGFGSGLIQAQFEDQTALMQLSVEPEYYLPFTGGPFRVSQCFGGTLSHTGTFFYSYDFTMPIGTPLTAARAGTVLEVEESFRDGDNTPGRENFVIIDHHDGTVSSYVHLTQNGVLVEVGDAVELGDTIALSGNTGNSTGPHLHFDVMTRCDRPIDDLCPTIEYWFVNTPQRQLSSGTMVGPVDTP